MMLYPSIDTLLSRINSKYTLVTLSSKRARLLQETTVTTLIEKPKSHKNVGIALEEIDKGLLRINKE